MPFYFSNVEHPRFSSFFALFSHLFLKNICFGASCQDRLRHQRFSYFPFCDCSTLNPICPTQDEPSCIELKDSDDL